MADRATGLIKRLYVSDPHAFIRLDIPADQHPGGGNGYFVLAGADDADLGAKAHPNYQAIYSLLLAAAVNRRPVTIRVRGESITTTANQAVFYAVTDFD